jgi:hypothetical protein
LIHEQLLAKRVKAHPGILRYGLAPGSRRAKQQQCQSRQIRAGPVSVRLSAPSTQMKTIPR